MAGAGSFRFAFGHFDVANASSIVLPEYNRTVGLKIVQDTLTKADQLPVAYTAPAPDAAELAKAADSAVESLDVTSPPATATPDVVEPAPIVVEQQAEEPVPPVARPIPPVVRKAKIEKPKVEKPKRKQPKPDAVASKPLPPVDMKTCQAEEFEAFRYAFNLPTGCHS
jgi:hypothetical protein